MESVHGGRERGVLDEPRGDVEDEVVHQARPDVGLLARDG